MSDDQRTTAPSDREPPEPIDFVDFDDPVLIRLTPLERELGHEVDDEEAAYIYAAQKAFGADAKRADLGYRLFCELRQEQED
jgi:hypothetical protein